MMTYCMLCLVLPYIVMCARKWWVEWVKGELYHCNLIPWYICWKCAVKKAEDFLYVTK